MIEVSGDIIRIEYFEVELLMEKKVARNIGDCAANWLANSSSLFLASLNVLVNSMFELLRIDQVRGNVDWVEPNRKE